MAKITYDNKSYLNQNSSIPNVNKVNDTDMNEIKSVVNTNDTNVGDLTNLATTDKTSIVNAINEVKKNKTYTQYKRIVGYTEDDEPIYRQVFYDILPNSGTGIITTVLRTLVDKIVGFGGFIEQSDGIKFGIPSTNPSGNADSNVTQKQFSRVVVLANGDLRLDASNNFKGQYYWVWVDYTEMDIS
jgi:hypothetical protein